MISKYLSELDAIDDIGLMIAEYFSPAAKI